MKSLVTIQIDGHIQKIFRFHVFQVLDDMIVFVSIQLVLGVLVIKIYLFQQFKHLVLLLSGFSHDGFDQLDVLIVLAAFHLLIFTQGHFLQKFILVAYYLGLYFYLFYIIFLLNIFSVGIFFIMLRETLEAEPDLTRTVGGPADVLQNCTMFEALRLFELNQHSCF